MKSHELSAANKKLAGWRRWALLTLLLAAVFRLAALSDVPPGLSQDEVLNADIVSFIQQGERALFFREGYGHEPLYHYWAVPFQTLFGDNVLSIRLPAVYLGLLLVALVMRWARRMFGGVTAVTAGLGLAVSWWPIIFSRVGLRPILEPLLLTAAAWFWMRRPWLAGLFLGLSLYSYTGARVVFLIPVLLGIVQFVLAADGKMRRQAVRTAVIILAAGLIIYAPLYFTLRADPTLQQRVDQLEGPLQALRQGDVGPVWQMTAATLGVFSFTGDPRWTYSLPGRPLFDPVTAVLFYVGLFLALSRLRQPRYTLILVWLSVTLLPSALTPQAPSTVRLVGAMPVVYLLPGLVVSAAVTRRPFAAKRRLLVVGGRLLLAAILFINVARTINDGFMRWPAALETRLKYQTVLLDMARHWQAEPVTRMVAADSFFEPIDADSLRRNGGGGPDVRWVQSGPEVGGALVFPREDGGDGRFYVPEFAAVPTDLLNVAGMAERPLYRSQSHPSFAVYNLPSELPDDAVAESATFEGAITLEGYLLAPVQTGRPLRLYTFWRVEAALPADLTAFVHLLTDEGAIIAQADGFDAAPKTLQPGDRIIQRHALLLPDPSPNGPMTLQMGLYTQGNGRRLVYENSQNGLPGVADHIILRRDWFLTETE